jgi:aconitate hydratase 2/2-methylisocitrate dehydratase
MSIYEDYLKEIDERSTQGLSPKPIDANELLTEIIQQIKDVNNAHRKASLDFFIYNVLPGTTSAAVVKAAFLKEIILGTSVLKEISPDFAFEQLAHMKGGPSVAVLLDLALGNDTAIANAAAQVLKTQVFLYEADTDRLENAYRQGDEIAKEIIESYAKAEFFYQITRS